MSDIKKIDLKEFIDKGYLQEVNREWFHPRGMALAIEIPEENEDGEYRLDSIWDSREDPEGFYFYEVDEEKTKQPLKDLLKNSVRRIKLMGNFIQPVHFKYSEDDDE